MTNSIDAAIRHQIYLEGVKNAQARTIEPTTEAIVAALAIALARSGYKTLSAMPKKILNSFIAAFNEKMAGLFAGFRKLTVQALFDLMKADASLSRQIFSSVSGKRVTADALSPNNKALWSRITNDTIPGTGHLPLNLLRDFIGGSANKIALLLKQAYSEGWTNEEVLKTITGTQARKFRDGLIRKLHNQFATVSQTLIQHVHSWINFKLGSLLAERYQWLSVLDGHTSDICISRSGRIYSYANGPRPPAHFNCRSTIAAIFATVTEQIPPSFYMWVRQQPLAVQNDILGPKYAQALRAGRVKATDLPRFDGTRPLTLAQFAGKQSLILT